MKEKTCAKCAETKPLGDFRKRATSPDGCHSYCKKCHRAEALAWKRANPERAKAAEKRWYEENRQRRYAANRHFQEEHPEKRRANRLVQNAVHRGRMEKPACCERCDTPVDRSALHAHHEDYGKPLVVDWLCRVCHGLVHRKPPRPKPAVAEAHPRAHEAVVPSAGRRAA